MNYQKPELLLLGPAICAIESQVKPDTTDPDSNFQPTDPAYQSDE